MTTLSTIRDRFTLIARWTLGAAAVLGLSFASTAWAEEETPMGGHGPVAHGEEFEPSIILEMGGAGEFPLRSASNNYGGSFGAEVPVIKHWLAVEGSVTTLGTSNTEVIGDLLFKKPFEIGHGIELMVGTGPSYSKTMGGADQGTQWAVENVVELMVWPTKHIGYYVQPSYSYEVRTGDQSLGVSGGFLIGF